MTPLPPNVKTGRILITDLSQQMKKERDFLRWMARRYKDENLEQSKAFATAAEMFDRLRNELLAGDFNVVDGSRPAREEFTAGELLEAIDELVGIETIAGIQEVESSR